MGDRGGTDPAGILRRHQVEDRAALHDGLMEEALRRRHRHHGAYLASASALSENGHIGGVSAEIGDIVTDPLQGFHDVQHAHVATAGVFRAICAQIQIPQGIEPVIQRNHDDPVVTSQVGPVITDQFLGRSLAETASVQPDHDRELAPRLDAGCPHIHPETVFTRKTVVPMHGESLVVIPPTHPFAMG